MPSSDPAFVPLADQAPRRTFRPLEAVLRALPGATVSGYGAQGRPRRGRLPAAEPHARSEATDLLAAIAAAWGFDPEEGR